MSSPAAPTRRKVLMQGNEAIVEGAIAAGMRFFAGYPITPSTEIAELASERLPAAGGRFIQMEDEIASMAAVVGASLAGRKAMTATSGPGFSLKQENLGFAAEAEVPCVVVNVQRQGPSTGLPTAPAQGDVMQARYGAHGDYAAIVLCPASVGEAYRLAVRAFNLAERFRMPVILLADEIIGHLRESVELPDPAELTIVDRARPSLPPESTDRTARPRRRAGRPGFRHGLPVPRHGPDPRRGRLPHQQSPGGGGRGAPADLQGDGPPGRNLRGRGTAGGRRRGRRLRLRRHRSGGAAGGAGGAGEGASGRALPAGHALAVPRRAGACGGGGEAGRHRARAQPGTDGAWRWSAPPRRTRVVPVNKVAGGPLTPGEILTAIEEVF